ncbi:MULTISPECIES: TlpA family protein disulfide reductase [unclassified Cellulophaga]|uniref:TlpA family protein disulfide reductase n=1 Tax=unclassified Cellulophaga TaxID=2634405 RepID=UPI0026E3C205|nr:MULTISPECIES: TlpA disulfide reductase family protein [unclassified Cellulophaga]MDO6490679.1 TlpA disulfide reductase family protein [Cellulophaga sp. 2_MG-2023]MDO6494127.1 TlpA disulfide reductase family protein [Cellulophaga sp. 3_MG-2023]
MKIIKCLFALALVVLSFSCKEKSKENGVTIGSLYISKATLKPGDSLDLKYTTDANEEDISAFYYYTVGSKTYPVDITLNKADSLYKSTIVIPDSATAVALNFKNKKEFDTNNDKGYLFPLTTSTGDTIPGAIAGLANYQLRMGNNLGLKVDEKIAFEKIKSDLLSNKDLQKDWDMVFPRTYIAKDKAGAKDYINSRVAYYNSKTDLSELEYKNLVSLYQTIEKKEKIDSLQIVMEEKFPTGTMAQQKAWSTFYNEQDYDKKKELFEEFKTKFEAKSRLKDVVATRLASAAIENGKKEEYAEIMDQVSDKSMLPSAYNTLAWNYAEKGENLEFASEISKKSLDITKHAINNPVDKPVYITKSQYIDNMTSTYNMYADTYALIKYKQGEIAEAIAYQKEAVADGKDPQLNERYVMFLNSDKKHDAILKEAALFIKEGNTTAKINDYYKQAYVAKNGSEDGFTENFESLEKVGYDKLVAKTKEEMIDKKPKNFKLKNTKGETVELAALKGKTVILDFWATWCGPCKASFPGMQQAVNKYKDNDKVVFLFVDTMESGDFDTRTKLAGDFVKNNNYSFNVVIDNPVKEGSRAYEVASNFEVNGIPTKVIIGPDGNIKFVSVGYSGSTDKLVKELSLKIDLLNS